MTQAAKMTQLAIAALEDKKAEDITLIDIAKVSVLADYFLIANGNNRNKDLSVYYRVAQKRGRNGCTIRFQSGAKGLSE